MSSEFFTGITAGHIFVFVTSCGKLKKLSFVPKDFPALKLISLPQDCTPMSKTKSPLELLVLAVNCIIQQILMGENAIDPQRFGWELFEKIS